MIRTENDALGYESSKSKLVDLNFKVPSYRDKIDTLLFDESLREDRVLTLKWLLYLRDIREGLGERSSFRNYLAYLCSDYTSIGYEFVKNIDIAEFGRWDDVVWLYFNIETPKIKLALLDIITTQLTEDIKHMNADEEVSLLAKWLPSANATNKETRRRGRELSKRLFAGSERTYRKTLSSLRKYLNVVEVSMSANRWQDIDYCAVPSRANLLYSDAFLCHDEARRIEYLSDVSSGKNKIHADSLFLYDIVHKMSSTTEDATLEALWKAQKKCDGFKDTLVVRDGSLSMTTPVSGHITAMDVADAITIYCAENNNTLKNRFLTFSARPKFIDLQQCETLRNKLMTLRNNTDYSTTNIESVFDIVLESGKIPDNILIISDLEFDRQLNDSDDKALFEHIKEKYEKAGYKLPKLIFWNVASRNNVIPLTENENGVIIISGFSKNLVDMVISSELDTYKALVNILNKKRYSGVDKIV